MSYPYVFFSPQPVREPEEIRSRRPSKDMDRAGPLEPSRVGAVLEESVALGIERDAYSTTSHSKSDERRDSRGGGVSGCMFFSPPIREESVFSTTTTKRRSCK